MSLKRFTKRFLFLPAVFAICIAMGFFGPAFSQSDTKVEKEVTKQNKANQPKEPAKDVPKEPVKEPVKEPEKKEPAPEETLELTPERYFQLLLERQKLRISSYKQMHKIVDHHNGNPLAAMKDLKKHEKEREIRIDKLFTKYHVDPKEYYSSKRGAEKQKERAKYLDQHPEVRDQIAAYSKELNELEKQFQAKMRPLWRPKSGGP
jgi:hypothetical protein